MIRRRWTAAVLVLVSVLAGGAAALAEEPAAPIDPAVASLAAEKGLSVAEATRRIGWQQRSANLADTLKAAVNADQLGGIWIGTDDRVTVGSWPARRPATHCARRSHQWRRASDSRAPASTS